MKTLMMAAAMCCATIAANAQATVVTFEGLADGKVPASYGGIDWSAGDWNVYSSNQSPYSPSSGNSRVYETDGILAAFNFADSVTFGGAYFAGYSSVTVSLFLAGDLVFSSTSAVSDVPTLIANGYAGLIDKVTVTGTNGNYWVMDDVTYDAPAVPEPASWAMMLGGFGLIGGAMRSRRKVAVSFG